MDKRSSISVVYLAPGASGGSHALQLPGAMSRAEYPALDDRLVEPETGAEVIDGELIQVLPAEPPHADTQCDVSYVIRANVIPGYVASTDLLTRVSDDSDFATDACIRREGIDPSTGTRYLEELSFEVKSTQSVADRTRRARMLIRRGVRRVFAIFVNKDRDGEIQAGPVKEWSPREDRWIELDEEREIVDACLARPVKVKALLSAAEASKEVSDALVELRHPSVVRSEQRKLEEQARKLRQEAIAGLCHALDIEVRAERKVTMESMDSEELRRLFDAIRAQRRWPRKVQP